MGISYTCTLIFYFIQLHNQRAMVDYFTRHAADIENGQLADLQESYRRRNLALKNDHNLVVGQLQCDIFNANAKFEQLNTEYDWMTAAYNDQLRTVEELQDRIDYLEDQIRENGHTSEATRYPPWSAPTSQNSFANLPREALPRPVPWSTIVDDSD
jgi:hypothetical protein